MACAVLFLVTQSCLTVCDPMDCSSPGSSFQGDSPGKNIGVGCQALLQGIFLTHGSNLHLITCPEFQADYLPLVLHGKPISMTTTQQLKGRKYHKWMKLKNIRLTERSQTQKHIYSMISSYKMSSEDKLDTKSR